jgi:hypothetical protein
MAALTERQQEIARLLLAETGLLSLSDEELESLATLHTRFAEDRARVTAAVPLTAEPALTFNPAARVSEGR